VARIEADAPTAGANDAPVQSTSVDARHRRALLAVLVGLLLLGAVGVAGLVEYQGSAAGLRARAGVLAGVDAAPLESDAVSTYHEVTLHGSSGLTAVGRLRVPRGAPPPYPAALLMGGVELGRRVVGLPGLETIGRSAVILALDYPLGPRRGPWEGRQFVAAIARLRTVGFDTIADVLLGLDYLDTRADVDHRRLFLIGSSMGAPAVTIAGGVDPRPAAVVALYGGGRLGSLVAHALRDPGQRHPYPWWQAEILGHALGWFLTPLAPERYVGAVSPRPYLMVNGRDDRLIPRANVEALYAAAREPKAILWLGGEHVEPDERALIHRVAGLVRDWLAERGLLPPA
jgi:dienelactone hydrolase